MDHLDRQALDVLKEVMEDDFSLLITTFLQDSENRIRTLSALIKSDNADSVRRAAHSFKGSCSNIGAILLASYCAVLEKKGAENNLDNIQDDIDLIKTEYEIVKELLLSV
jgi:histidine phosphotransfer protein HptB